MEIGLHEELLRAGIEIGTLGSDLYVLDDENSRRILARHEIPKGRSTMRSQTTGKVWIVLPGAVAPGLGSLPECR